MLSRIISWCFVLVMMIACGGAQAVVLYQDNFDDDPAGTNSDPLTPQVGQDWQVTELTDSRVAVLSDFSVSPSNSLFVRRLGTDDAGAPLASAPIDAAGQVLVQDSQVANISFEMLLADDGADAASIIRAYSGSSVIMNLFMFRDSSSAGHLGYFNGSAFVDTDLGFTIDEWQSVDVDLDFAAGTFSVSIEGSSTAQSTDIAFQGSPTTFDAFAISASRVGGNPGSPGQGYFDDILITTVPEPASVGLLSAGLVLMVRRRGGDHV